jgi:hypothetical protein
LSPGLTATELAKHALGEEGQKVFAEANPLQRMADPAEIGADVVPTQLADAVEADIVFLAVRFESHGEVAKALPIWRATTTAPPRRSVRLRGISVFRRSSSAGFRKVDCASGARTYLGSTDLQGFGHVSLSCRDARSSRSCVRR